MSRSEIFHSRPKLKRLPKNLRHNAREAAEFLTGLKPDEADDSHAIVGRPGRGASGESSN